MIKMIVSDLDGTLLGPDHKVPDKNREALARAEQAGITVCLASGRMRVEMTEIMKHTGVRYASVCQNGASIYTIEGELLDRFGFEPVLAGELYDAIAGSDLLKVVCTSEHNYIKEWSPAAENIQRRLFDPFKTDPDLGEAVGSSIQMCKISLFGGMELLLSLKSELAERFGGRVDMYVSDKDCLDIMPDHVSKGNGLRKLCSHLGLSPDEIACFGDSYNDLSMFAVTPHSFAMSHSDGKVRSAATHTTGSVHEAVDQVISYNLAILA